MTTKSVLQSLLEGMCQSKVKDKHTQEVIGNISNFRAVNQKRYKKTAMSQQITEINKHCSIITEQCHIKGLNFSN